ncbi:uncharacterized protein LOC142224098 [Haematobia irritans]|uniref:uncharacterized protein LOC142224098 n=1 Tax=Haematobia irritans TaxID=7368 RepID=UPI003F4F8E88
MKISIYLAVSLLAIMQLFSIAEAEVYHTEDDFSEYYYYNLHKALWSYEIFVMVDQLLNDLRLWMSLYKGEILEKGLTPELTRELEKSFGNASASVKTLLMNGENEENCSLTISLRNSLDDIINILSRLRDTKLATLWYDIYRGFDTGVKVIRKDNLRRFVDSLDDEVRFLLDIKTN